MEMANPWWRSFNFDANAGSATVVPSEGPTGQRALGAIAKNYAEVPTSSDGKEGSGKTSASSLVDDSVTGDPLANDSLADDSMLMHAAGMSIESPDAWVNSVQGSIPRCLQNPSGMIPQYGFRPCRGNHWPI